MDLRYLITFFKQQILFCLEF